jgi:hypothetical protein
VRSLPVAALVALLWVGAASAQEEDFQPWVGEPEPPPAEEPPPPAPPPPPPAPPTWPGPSTSEPRRTEPRAAPSQKRVVRPAPRPEDFNRVSLHGGQSLGTLQPAAGAYLGFPLLGIRAGMGLADRVDAGVGFDSFYGVMNEFRGYLRVGLVQELHWAFAFQVEAGHAFFAQRPEVEQIGARWLTGRRNWNIEPGVQLSWRGNTVQSARLFVDLRYHAALDTQPYTEVPLGGVPPAVVWGHNVPFRAGAEMPFSPTTSFLFMFGFDIHGRGSDAPFMPTLAVGLVAGL